MGVKIGKGYKALLLLLISLVIIGIILGVNLLSFAKAEKVILSQIQENQLIKTESAAMLIEDHVAQVRNELLTLSKFPPMETLDVNACSGDMKVVHEKIESKINSLLRVDKEGNIVESSSSKYSNYLNLNIKNKDYFKVPKETSEPLIVMVKQGESQQIIIAAPLFNIATYTPYPNLVGNFNGALLSIIEVDELYNIYIHPIINANQNYFVLYNLASGEVILGNSDFGQNESSNLLFNPSSNDSLNFSSNTPAHISSNFSLLPEYGASILPWEEGDTIATSANLFVGGEKWRLSVLTPLKNVGTEIRLVQKLLWLSLGLVIAITVTLLAVLISLYRTKEEVQHKLERANVTLEKLGIRIETEKDKFAQIDIILEPRKVYLIREDGENTAHELFIGTLNRGFAGLGIVRDDPRALKKKYNLEKTSFIWLTKEAVTDVPCETNIVSLFGLISEFIRKSKKSVVLIDRLDYILTENKFEEVIPKIHALRDLAQNHESIIILALSPEAIEESKLKAIEAETIDLYGRHLRSKVELTEMEMGILHHINDYNITNRLVSYKDITEQFKITKPTTRVKVGGLQRLGLVQTEQKGRFKSLKITSAGRKIIGV